MPFRTLLVAGVAMLAVAVSPAVAADPESGEVGPSKPTATWTGTVTDPSGAYDLGTFFAEQMGPTCQPPSCDTFTLNVKGGNALTIKVAGDGAENIVFEVEDPDGETRYVEATADLAAERETTFDAPKPGEWTVRVAGTGEFEYKGTATVPGAAAPAGGGAPPAGNTPPPSSTPPPSGQPAPSPQPSPQPAPQQGTAPSSTVPLARLTIRALAKKARAARKLRKGRTVRVALTTTAPLKNVTALLVPTKKRSQVLGTGRVASLASKSTVRLKLKKAAKRGRYVLLVSGIDAQGRRIVAQRAVTVTR